MKDLAQVFKYKFEKGMFDGELYLEPRFVIKGLCLRYGPPVHVSCFPQEFVTVFTRLY